MTITTTACLMVFMLSTLFLAQHADAQSCAAESQKRRDSCVDLVKPYPPGQGCWSQGKCCTNGDSGKSTTPSNGASESSSGATSSNGGTSKSVTTTSGKISTPNGIGITTTKDGITTIATSEGVCTCTCEDSSAPSDAASEVTEDASQVTESGSEATETNSDVTETENSEASTAGVSAGVTTSDVLGSTKSGDYIECELTDYLFNISLLLVGEEYDIFIEWIHEIQVTILANTALSYEQMIVQCGYSLKVFFEEHVEIKNVLLYEKLGNWGYCNDFIYVAYQIQIEITEEIITLDADGDCTLFEAIRNATSEDDEKSAACEKLFFKITIILESSSWTYTQKQAQIYLLFVQFFEQYPQWKSYFFSIQIDGYGLFEYYFDVTYWYHQITTISVVIGGDVSECALIDALYAASQNASYSVTVRNEFKQLYKKIEAYFSVHAEISLRLEYLVAECYSLWQLSGYMEVYVQEVSCGWWGYIIDIIFCSNICINDGCDDIDDGSGCDGNTTSPSPGASSPSSGKSTTESASTDESSSPTDEVTDTTIDESESPSSEANSSPAGGSTTETVIGTSVVSSSSARPVTTTEPATSTPQPADCGTRWSLLEIHVSTNTTYFTKSVQRAYNSWNASTKASFNTYKNKIWNAVYDRKATRQNIFSQVITACQQFNKNNKWKQQILWNVTVTEWRGTIGQFVGCGSKCACK